jgi:hypothetical protein
MALFKHKAERAPGPIPSPPQPGLLVAWQAEDDRLAQLIELGRGFRGATASELEGGSPVALKAGERIYFVLEGAALIEPRSAGGHWEGRTQGVSIRVPGTKSMRYRVGANKGRYVRDGDQPTPIDTGTAVITDKRLVFAGAKQAREWVWTKTIGLQHQENAPWTAVPVSNRQKVSGIAYDDAHAGDIRFRLDLALAVATETTDMLIAELEADRAEHATHRPGAPLPPPISTAE